MVDVDDYHGNFNSEAFDALFERLCERYIYHIKDRRPFYKKGPGARVMVSEFLSVVDGPIKEGTLRRVPDGFRD
ncbi:hypothetical protein BGZ65_006109, partial [Modicella reniformis]